MKRLLTGFTYMALLVGFYVLKVLLNLDFFFDIPVYAFSLLGTYEMLGAFAHKAQTDRAEGKEANTDITKSQKITVWIYAILFTPLFVVAQTFIQFGMQAMFLIFVVAVLVLLLLLVVDYGKVTLGGTGCAMLTCLYPTGVLGFVLLTNHLVNASGIAILFIFITSPASDSFAYLFGKYLGKFFPKKMAPTISPKKTMIGGLGGLIGGAVGAVVLYLVYTLVVPDFVLFECSSQALVIAAVAVIGIVSAFLTEIGDLVESCIKRKVGIKDMGKILPGHGGILDRIDGTLFTAVFIYCIFSIISLI